MQKGQLHTAESKALMARQRSGKEGCVTPYARKVDQADAFRVAHVLIAELALGKPLPVGAEVHHVNGNGRDNRKENLVICPSTAYHHLLHTRMRALEACGHADWRKCKRCKQYDDPSNLRTSGREAYHLECARAHARKLAQNRRIDDE